MLTVTNPALKKGKDDTISSISVRTMCY